MATTSRYKVAPTVRVALQHAARYPAKKLMTFVQITLHDRVVHKDHRCRSRYLICTVRTVCGVCKEFYHLTQSVTRLVWLTYLSHDMICTIILSMAISFTDIS